MNEEMSDIADSNIKNSPIDRTSPPGSAGYAASIELLQDLIHPFLSTRDLRDARVAEIGDRSGAVARMLAAAGCGDLTEAPDSGELPPTADRDFVVSIGVLSHMQRPEPVVRAALGALRPGGRVLLWLYGREGNERYLQLALPLRRLTRRLPPPLLSAVSSAMMVPLSAYLYLCHYLDLPMKDYMLGHLGRLGPEAQLATIREQLRPGWVRYYTRDEAEDLLRVAGFVEVRSFNRHGYSWTVVGSRPS